MGAAAQGSSYYPSRPQPQRLGSVRRSISHLTLNSTAALLPSSSEAASFLQPRSSNLSASGGVRRHRAASVHAASGRMAKGRPGAQGNAKAQPRADRSNQPRSGGRDCGSRATIRARRDSGCSARFGQGREREGKEGAALKPSQKSFELGAVCHRGRVFPIWAVRHVFELSYKAALLWRQKMRCFVRAERVKVTGLPHHKDLHVPPEALSP